MSQEQLTVAALFRCPVCENEYPSQAEAEGCRKTPFIPKGTKWAVKDGYTADDYLMIVRDVDGSGCNQMLRIKPHPDFWSSMKTGISRDLKSGYCYVQKRPNRRSPFWCDRPLVALTREVAENSLKQLAAHRARLKKQDRELAKREEVLRQALTDLLTP